MASSDDINRLAGALATQRQEPRFVQGDTTVPVPQGNVEEDAVASPFTRGPYNPEGSILAQGMPGHLTPRVTDPYEDRPYGRMGQDVLDVGEAIGHTPEVLAKVASGAGKSLYHGAVDTYGGLKDYLSASPAEKQGMEKANSQETLRDKQEEVAIAARDLAKKQAQSQALMAQLKKIKAAPDKMARQYASSKSQPKPGSTPVAMVKAGDSD